MSKVSASTSKIRSSTAILTLSYACACSHIASERNRPDAPAHVPFEGFVAANTRYQGIRDLAKSILSNRSNRPFTVGIMHRIVILSEPDASPRDAFQLAVSSIRSGRYREAYGIYHDDITEGLADSDGAPPWLVAFALAIIEAREGRFADAEVLLMKARRMVDGDNDRVAFWQAVTLCAERKTRQAEMEFFDTISSDLDSPVVGDAGVPQTLSGSAAILLTGTNAYFECPERTQRTR